MKISKLVVFAFGLLLTLSLAGCGEDEADDDVSLGDPAHELAADRDDPHAASPGEDAREEDSLEATLAAAQSAARAAGTVVQALEAELASARAQMNAQAAELGAAMVRIGELQGLETENAHLDANLASISGQRDMLAAELRTLHAEQNRLIDDISALRRRLAAALEDNRALEQRMAASSAAPGSN